MNTTVQRFMRSHTAQDTRQDLIDCRQDRLQLLVQRNITDEEMEQIAKLDKNERYYHRTDEQLVQFANWKPEFEK